MGIYMEEHCQSPIEADIPASWHVSFINHFLLEFFSRFTQVDFKLVNDKFAAYKSANLIVNNGRSKSISGPLLSANDATYKRRRQSECRRISEERAKMEKQFKSGSEHPLAKSERQTPMFDWPRIVLAFYILIFIHLSLSIAFQYMYDRNLFHMNHLKIKSKSSGNSEEAEVARLNELVVYYSDILQTIGSPHMSLHFAVQLIYGFILGSFVLFYFFPQYYYKRREKFDYAPLRVLIDANGERQRASHLVSEQVDQFIRSSRLFSREEKHLIGRCLKLIDLQSCNPSDWAFDELDMCAVLGRQLEWMQDACNNHLPPGESAVQSDFDPVAQLRYFVCRNRLMPHNLQPSWTQRQARLFCYVMLACLVYSLFMNTVVAFGMYNFYDPERHASRWTDLLIMIELFLVLLGVNFSSLYFIIGTLFTCLDFVMLKNRIVRSFDDCIQGNRIILLQYKLTQAQNDWTWDFDDSNKFHGRKPSRNDRKQRAETDMRRILFKMRSGNDAAHEINSNLLFVLMHYRIFVTQVRPIGRSLRTLTIVGIILLFYFPILSRIHTPYVEERFVKEVRSFSVALSIIVLVPVNACLVPVCLLHTSCTDLYKSLYRLVAHVSQIHSERRLRDGLAFDRHTVCVLRKELYHPECWVNQFQQSNYRLSFTFAELVRLHFYFGFILLSIAVESLSGHKFELFGFILNDPLRLYA